VRRRSLAALVAAAVLSVVACEVVVRALVTRDADGQEWVRDVRLLPYRLPLPRIAELLTRVANGATFLAYDPDLGWAPRRSARSAGDRYRVETGGIRRDADVPLAPPPGVLRVALFGDSFTFGDEVPLDETWGAFLERGLASRGVAAEVLNFGVNAYGMDQAYLRWQRDGRRYRPQVVVYGFQPENALRNLNVFRSLYFAGSEVPLSKPRFVLRDGALATVNVPTVPPGDLAGVLAALDAESLLEHERYGGWYEERWWRRSKVVALLEALGAQRTSGALSLDAEARDLAERLVAAFADDVAASGAAFLVVHLPRKADAIALRDGEDLWYDALLRALDGSHTVVDPFVGVRGPVETLFAERGHYAAGLNRAVGEALVGPVLEAARAARR
jgi:hypothetical protein